jgi:D-alanyl-D-alanine carboxypeptidase
VESLAPIDASPPNLRDEMCGPKRKRPASDEDEETIASSPSTGETGATFFAAALPPPVFKPADLLAQPPEPSEPVVVYTGPTRTGAALIAAVAADTEKDTPKPRKKKTHVAAKKPDASADGKPDSKSDAKPDAKQAKAETKQAAKPEAKPAAKPAAIRHANAKSDGAAAKPSEKPAAAAGDKPAAKPAKPKAVAKPKNDAKPAS